VWRRKSRHTNRVLSGAISDELIAESKDLRRFFARVSFLLAEDWWGCVAVSPLKLQ
jgi:hypothetical protein